jgi:uncharacterized membrane protein YphA (DoxX/SURF4 family)
MNILRLVSKILIGLIFIFSGIVKGIDPLGSAYKFHDYFQAFNLEFLTWLSLPLAVLLCTGEFIAGFSVLTGLKQKTGIWVVMILMSIFTPLTFILALTNQVSDCGCFGDAIHLTNWQTFGKNIILLIPAIYLFMTRNRDKQQINLTRDWVIIFSVIVIFIAFISYNLRYLPIVDFLPYKTGTNIPEKMVIPDSLPPDIYETTFIYEKDGLQKEFALTNYPAGDTTWKFIDQKSVLVKKGYQPPIHDFTITSIDGTSLTEEILSSSGFTLLMISKKLSESDKSKLAEGFELGRFCTNNNIDFYVLTASSTNEAGSYNNGLDFCLTDETTLKTIVRANPGYMLLKGGTIIGKWSWSNVPAKEWFGKEAKY